MNERHAGFLFAFDPPHRRLLSSLHARAFRNVRTWHNPGRYSVLIICDMWVTSGTTFEIVPRTAKSAGVRIENGALRF